LPRQIGVAGRRRVAEQKELQMQSNTVRAGVGALVIAAAIVLFLVLKGGGDDSSAPSQGAANTTGASGAKQAAPTIVVKGGKPVGGIRELDYTKGDRVRFRVESDVSDEVHVHGYDLMKDVAPGHPVSFEFPANLEGVFEAELEGRKEQIIELRVNP
jgi:hypothetical protein